MLFCVESLENCYVVLRGFDIFPTFSRFVFFAFFCAFPGWLFRSILRLIQVRLWLSRSLFPGHYISLFPEIFQDFRDAFLLLGIHIKDLFAAGQLQPGGCQLHIGLGIMDLGDNADHLAVGHAGDAWGKQAVRLDS